MRKPRILVIGEICMKVKLKLCKMPVAGEKISAGERVYLPGGNGVEASVALSRLGADAVVSAKVGDDIWAKELSGYLRSEKVDIRFVGETKDESTAELMILDDGSGRPATVISSGASSLYSESDVEEAFISYPDAVIIDSELDYYSAAAACRFAVEREIPVFVTSGESRKTLSGVAAHGCEILSVNDAEVEALTGIIASDQESCMKACIELSRLAKAKYIVLRLGDRGYFIFDGMYYSFVSAYDIDNRERLKTDKAFTAALSLEYIRSEGDIRRSTEYAAIVVAIYLSRGGELRAYPSEADVRKFAEQNEIEFDFGDK